MSFFRAGWDANAASEDDSPYHAGERSLQLRSGMREFVEPMGRKMIRPTLPDQHRRLFAELPWLLIGGLDAAGQVWASVLVGKPGFVRSTDPATLEIDAFLPEGDPLAPAIVAGRALGVLGIQLETRRRMRVNGRIHALTEAGFRLRVDQSFGNCPKYITRRVPIWTERGEPPVVLREASVLSARAQAIVARADTCFIASASSALPTPGDAREGADVSHRGGQAPFVRVTQTDDATTLVMPDYPGNNAFNTLGNLSRYPSGGLLFPDFASGDVLLLSCTTEIIWDGPEFAQFDGAERLVRFRVQSGLYFRERLPFRWSLPAGTAPR